MASSPNQENLASNEKTAPVVSTPGDPVLPDGTALLESQVAGHPYDPIKNNIGKVFKGFFIVSNFIITFYRVCLQMQNQTF